MKYINFNSSRLTTSVLWSPSIKRIICTLYHGIYEAAEEINLGIEPTVWREHIVYWYLNNQKWIEYVMNSDYQK